MAHRTWDWGAEGAAFAVQRGQTWQVGRHAFTCGSLTALPAVPGDVLYCDPPWNNAIASAFRNNAGYTPAEAGSCWQDIYQKIIGLACSRPLFIEGGEKQAAEVQSMLRMFTEPGLIVRQWPITYSRATRPAVLHYAGAGDPGDASGLDSADTPGWAMSRFPPGTVADLTAGRGHTARCAESAGWQSWNLELDPGRVSAALTRLARLTGQAPVLAG